MKFGLTALSLIVAATLCPAQTQKPPVDWDTIARNLDAVQAAVKARDIDAAQKASSTLWQFATGEMVKQSPTAGERLATAEARRAPGDTTSLAYLAMLAAEAGLMEKADTYAHDALQHPTRAYDVVHDGNIVLGLVALSHGDTSAAKNFLLEAVKTKGNESLKRFGPTLALAKALLEKGENQAVLAYFEGCKSFVTQNPKLDDWIATLKGGAAPDLSHEYLWMI